MMIHVAFWLHFFLVVAKDLFKCISFFTGNVLLVMTCMPLHLPHECLSGEGPTPLADGKASLRISPLNDLDLDMTST